jgi:hypothetical protein
MGVLIPDRAAPRGPRAGPTQAARPKQARLAVPVPVPLRAPRGPLSAEVPRRGLSSGQRWAAGAAGAVLVGIVTFAAVAARASRTAPALNLPSQHHETSNVQVQAPQSTEPRIFQPPPAPGRDLQALRYTDAAPPKPEAPSGLPGHHNVAILSRYDQGNVDAAIAVAEQEDDQVLLPPLQKFSRLYRTGKQAMAAGDKAAAIRSFSAALAVDRQLSRGSWGRYRPELKSLLARLR